MISQKNSTYTPTRRTKMKLLTALLIAMSVLFANSAMAEDGDDKKPEKEEKKKKEKKKLPEELMTLRKDLAKKVKAGDITKEQAKEQFKTAMKEHKKKNPKKKEKKEETE